MGHLHPTTLKWVSIFMSPAPWQLTNSAACVHADIGIWRATPHTLNSSLRVSWWYILFALNTITSAFIKFITVFIVIISTIPNQVRMHRSPSTNEQRHEASYVHNLAVQRSQFWRFDRSKGLLSRGQYVKYLILQSRLEFSVNQCFSKRMWCCPSAYVFQ